MNLNSVNNEEENDPIEDITNDERSPLLGPPPHSHSFLSSDRLTVDRANPSNKNSINNLFDSSQSIQFLSGKSSNTFNNSSSMFNSRNIDINNQVR
jgi:hypothetical protein